MNTTKAKGLLVLDRAMLGFAIIIFGLGGSWVRMELGMNANTDKIVSTNVAIASVKLEYAAADKLVASAHTTQFVRLDAEVNEVQRDVTEQAISIGEIKAGVAYIVNSIDNN